MATKSPVIKKKPATKSTPAKSTASKTAATKKTPAKKDAAKELKDLFEDSLKDIYWAEKALTKALPKMHKNATDVKLKNAISDHLAQTQTQVKRLEDCFAELGKKAQAKKCDAMQMINRRKTGRTGQYRRKIGRRKTRQHHRQHDQRAPRIKARPHPPGTPGSSHRIPQSRQ